MVVKVEPDSPAAHARIDVGAFITNVGDARVHNPKEFRAALVGRAGPVKLQVVRGAATASETVEVSAK
ncbi:MAG: PDZ domain-containing protein [Pirellulales bacterium]